MTTARDAYADVRGLRLHYLDWGTSGLPPLVCLHGITQTAHSWDEVAPALARTHHVRALDQRGHGESSWAPDGDYRIETQSGDVEQFLPTVGAAPAVLVALSMGGLNAMTLAARAPSLVRALVVVDIAPQVERKGVEAIRNFVAATDELDSFEAFVERAHAFNPRRSLDNIRDRLRHNLRQLPTGRWTWKYDPALRDPHAAEWRNRRPVGAREGHSLPDADRARRRERRPRARGRRASRPAWSTPKCAPCPARATRSWATTRAASSPPSSPFSPRCRRFDVRGVGGAHVWGADGRISG